jgi:hypothetical protein
MSVYVHGLCMLDKAWLMKFWTHPPFWNWTGRQWKSILCPHLVRRHISWWKELSIYKWFYHSVQNCILIIIFLLLAIWILEG